MFIRTIPPSDAQGPVREMYEQVRARFGYVPNWAQAFSLRPGVREGWAALLKSIQSNLWVRNYELATLAAARALRSSYCSLAHGRRPRRSGIRSGHGDRDHDRHRWVGSHRPGSAP